MSSVDFNNCASAKAKLFPTVLFVGKVEDFRTFRALLVEAESLYGAKKDVAARLGIDAAHYSKVYHGAAGYALNVENCLRLAQLLGRPPGDVLRAAGKTDIADLLDASYGTPSIAPIPGGKLGRELLAEWERLTDGQRSLAVRMIQEMSTRTTQAEVAGQVAPKKKSLRSLQRAQ